MTRRVDQSMSLLSDIAETALEPGYLAASRHGDKSSRLRFGITLGLLAALLVVAGVSTTKGSGEAASERDDLLRRVQQEDERRSRLDAEVNQLEVEIRRIGDAQVTDPGLRQQISALEPETGVVPVRGPGVVVVVDDGDSDAKEAVVFDSDLSRLVDGLRQAGAEAIAINGRRLTSLTPIRTAGSAITVDYVSLSPPYRVEAIGDPRTLESRFARTSAAAWWHFIRDNYGVTFTIATSKDELELAADPGMTLRYAQK